MQIQAQGFDTVAVRTSRAWWKEGDDGDNSRVGYADGVVALLLAISQQRR